MEARWLVQTEDGELHAYITRGLLLVDLARNRGEVVKLYVRKPRLGVVRFVPTTEEAIREDMRNEQ